MLDKLPLTPNGKLDRSALPEPEARSAADTTEPRTEVETELAGMWARLLGVGRVGINDNFFELGGHSLLAMQVLAEVRGEFGLDLPLRQLFENPTVAMLAALIEQAQIDQAGGDMLDKILAELDQLTEENAEVSGVSIAGASNE
jgi:acyl carrier protein